MPGTSNPASGGSTPSSGGNPVPPPSNPAPSVTSSQAGPGPTGSAQTGSISTGEDLTSTYANASASVGGCSNVVVPGGWDGVASTSVSFCPTDPPRKTFVELRHRLVLRLYGNGMYVWKRQFRASVLAVQYRGVPRYRSRDLLRSCQPKTLRWYLELSGSARLWSKLWSMLRIDDDWR